VTDDFLYYDIKINASYQIDTKRLFLLEYDYSLTSISSEASDQFVTFGSKVISLSPSERVNVILL
jgi:hypothetical protein